MKALFTDFKSINLFSIFNNGLLIITIMFLFYLMVITPSMLVPYNENFGNKINKASLEELKIFSIQLADWVKISNNSLNSLTTIFFWFGILVIIISCINLYLIKKIKKTNGK